MAYQEILHFRIMLTKLSHVLGSRELELMKYMCLDKIPRSVMEEINTPIDFWIVLEERAIITPGDLSFLELLLSSACAGRQDVCQILIDYKNNSYLLDNEGELSEAFDLITNNIGSKWRKLARKLGLTEMEIHSIVNQSPSDLQEQIRQSLLTWKRKNKHSVGRTELINALELAEFRMLAHQVQTASR